MKYTDIDLSDKKILITGGAGFIGSNLAFYFQENHPEAKVIVFDKFRDGSRFDNGNLTSFGHYKNLIGFRGEIISGDINSIEDIQKLSKIKPDYIFHEAAISDTTVNDQNIMIQTNVNAFKSFLDIAVQNNSTLVYASSGATYGDAPSPQRVGVESPNNVYGFSKLSMDYLCYEYIKNHPKLNIVGLRYFNVYGKNEYFKDKTSSMVLQFGHQILRGNTPKLFEGSDKILRDFIYIEDIIQANIKAMSPKKSGVYNVGTGKARSFQDIADILQDVFGTDLGNEYIPNPFIGQYQFFTQADIESSKEFLDYYPNYSLEDGIKAYASEIKRVFSE